MLRENALQLKTDLCFKPTILMHDESKETQDFTWYSEGGVIENIAKVRSEFNQFRGLKPVRVCLIGPPISGKTFFSEILAKDYNIENIKINEVVDQFSKEYLKLGKELVEGEEEDPQIKELKDLIAGEQEKFDTAQKASKKPKGKGDEDVQKSKWPDRVVNEA